MNLQNISNNYVDNNLELFEAIPKSVWAAIAISFATLQTEDGSKGDVVKAILAEWKCLHENGIVPQAPIKPKQNRKAFKPWQLKA